MFFNRLIQVFLSIAIIACNALCCGQDKKSLVIGIDGLGFGANGFSVAETPWMDGLIDGTWQTEYQGAYSDSAFAGGVSGTVTQQPTVSGPGWSTMLTGVWVNRHAVSDNGNTFVNGNFADNPAFFGTVKSIDNTLMTASFVHWTPIDSNVINSVDIDADPNNDLDFRGDYNSDLQIAQAVANTLASGTGLDPDVTFVAFDEVDGAGHSFGGSSIQYQQQIELADQYVGMILTNVASRPNFQNENWQIVITSDHGHVAAGGHGGQSSLERIIPFIVTSKNLHQGDLPAGVSQADVPPTVIAHFGFQIPKHYWGHSRADGAEAPRTIVATDNFSNVPLQPFTAADAGDGTDWSATIGSGSNQWTVDNSGMSGTTTELAYFGWAAVDADSWIDEQGTQIGRSVFANEPNNTILLADPDAWDDFTTGATQPGFNSFVSREFNLAGFDLSTLRIQFEYEFVTEATQRGTAEVSFDGGTVWQLLAEFDSATVANNTIFVGTSSSNVGADFNATSDQMLLRFGCIEAGNNWWFAVDNIGVSVAQVIPGDLNGDGVINLLDVQPFVDALSAGEFVAAADINGDGEVNLLDVALFVDLLGG